MFQKCFVDNYTQDKMLCNLNSKYKYIIQICSYSNQYYQYKMQKLFSTSPT